MNKQKMVVLDLDGTAYPTFLEDDKKIIRQMFSNHFLVRICDWLLRKINDFDIIKNNIRILKLRLVIYSILAWKAPGNVLETYKKLYLQYAKNGIFEEYDRNLLRLEKAGFRVIVISNNLFSESISLEDDMVTILTTASKSKTLHQLSRENDICFLVGNNYMDDMCEAYLLGIPSIYVGQSRFVTKSKRTSYAVNTLTKAIDLIIGFQGGDK